MVKSSSLFILCLGLLILTGCGDRPFYEEYVEVPENGWDADSAVAFNVEISDTAADYNIFLNLRHNDKYPYSNIYFFREIRSARGIEFRDTVEYKLADPYGKWLGSGVGELKTLQWPYSSKPASFRKAGDYTFVFTQAMRQEKLQGIEDVGISIFKSKAENQENGAKESK